LRTPVQFRNAESNSLPKVNGIPAIAALPSCSFGYVRRLAEILTLRQVADFLKVTERTIYRLAAAKKIPAFKVGGTWRFSKAEINQWIQQQSGDGRTDRT
jgi:excisionase family DNA binding protein